MTNPTERFTSRVENYVKYRPSYPAEIVPFLAQKAALTTYSTVVDVGSGTGISSALFLQQGYRVIGVEPNAAMRAAAEHMLAENPRFTSISATAEATALPDQSADLVVAGQAFHWFDQARARAEFARILKPNGTVALMWNERLDATPFLREYDQLIATFGSDYHQVRHETVSADVVRAFFAPDPVEVNQWPNAQQLDYQGLQGRLLSSSYMPQNGDPRYEPMIAELQRLFNAYQENGTVAILYTTLVYTGGLRPLQE